MKLIFFASLALLAFASLPASSETPAKTPRFPVQRIVYTRLVPPAVQKRMTKGARSCFAGSLKLSTTGQNFFVHFYNEDPTDDFKPRPDNDSLYNFAADIFQMRGTSAARRYRFTKHFPVKYRGWPWAPNRFGAQLLWLDPPSRHSPIIKFECINDPVRFNVFCVFPQGFAGQVSTQAFISGWWRSSGSAGQDVDFDTIDEKGFLQIKTREYIPTSEIPQPPPVTWKWNGKEFQQGTTYRWNGKEYETIPEKNDGNE